MRIALDVSIQETPYVTGVERVQRSLLVALAALDRDNEYLLVSRKPVELPFELPPNFRTIAVVRDGSPYLWRERFVPPLLDRERVDVFHSPVSATPILGRARKIATLHELPWIERGRRDSAAEGAPASHRAWLYLNVRWTHHLVCVSERTRQNVLQLYPDAGSRLSVIHHGVDAKFRPLDPKPDRKATLGSLGIPDRPFVLFVGTLRRKKNLRLLLRVFAALPAAAREEYSLVLAGVRGATFSELEESLRDPALDGRVFLPGYVTDGQLVALYNLASCVVYPSLFEGFGLPPLEAMACGAPVVTSNGGAIPEIVGDAAARFESSDGDGLKETLLRVLEDGAYAASLVSRGFERAREFTWERAARRYLELYRATAAPSLVSAREASAGE